MDDWDNWGEAYAILEGDAVTVYGRVDDDLFELTSIEASSVYVQDLNTYFYANPADEESLWQWNVVGPIVLGQTTVRGTVTAVDVFSEEFTIDTGFNQISVDASELAYSPLDNVGFQQVEPGDRVSVTGIIDREFFDGPELVADLVVTLQD